MGNGTVIVRHVASGTQVHLLCVTRGGAGWNGLPPGRRPEELTAIRTEELERAAGVLGLASVELWDYPDGGVPACDQDEITSRIRDAVGRLDPEVVLGWGPDGGYGHPDHIAVGACTDAALAGSGRALYHLAFDTNAADAIGEWVARVAPQSGMQVAGIERPDVIFEPAPAELETIKRAVECHQSQLSPMYRALLDDEAAFYWLARNGYVRVGEASAAGSSLSL